MRSPERRKPERRQAQDRRGMVDQEVVRLVRLAIAEVRNQRVVMELRAA